MSACSRWPPAALNSLDKSRQTDKLYRPATAPLK